MASISQSQLRQSWITPQEQLEILASSIVRERLDLNKEQLGDAPEILIDQIASSAIRSTLKSTKGEAKDVPTLFDMVVQQHLIEPRPLPSKLTNWYTTLERIDALPEKVPPLPLDILDILNSECPIYGTEEARPKISETHSLYLLPAGTLNELELRVSSYGQKFFQDENPLQFRRFDHEAREEHANILSPEPQWVLISNDVLPESLNYSYKKQVQIVQTLSAKSLADYQVPTLREAIGAAFLHKVATGISLYPAGNEQHCGRYTRLKETTQDWHLIVGSYAPSGMRVSYLYGDGPDSDIGVSAVRKF